MSDNFTIYGYNFQIKLLVSLLTDKNFLEQIVDILQEDFFESDANKWLIKQIKKYYNNYHKQITLDALKIELAEEKSSVLKTMIVEHLRDVNKYFRAKDLEIVKEKTITFCRNQKLKTAIMQSIDLLEYQQYDKIKELIDEASTAGVERHLGHDYSNDIDERYSTTQRHCVATPWPVINDLVVGGLGKGELGVVVGNPGSGKSWSLIALGAEAIKKKKKVVHYTLELSAEYTGLRYDSVLTGIPFQNLKYHQDEIKNRIKQQYSNSLIIKQYPATIADVNIIRAHLKKIEILAFKPDIIIVDYADLLNIGNRYNNRNDNSYSIGGKLYEQLRGLATELEIPIWTASQANRESSEDDTIEGNKIAESYKKIMTADFIFSMSRKIEDKIAGTGRIHIIKNRFGPDGLTYNAKINTSNGNISIYENGTLDSFNESKKQVNGAAARRKILSNRYKELQKGKLSKKN